MSTPYALGAENVRRTHTNAIERVVRFTISERFKTLTIVDLDARMELFMELYVEFVDEHQKLVATLRDPTKFLAEDAFFSKIEHMYRETIIRFRS